eukprot:scaffold197199_cov20-Tisochrysis_lutea.AAC.1
MAAASSMLQRQPTWATPTAAAAPKDCARKTTEHAEEVHKRHRVLCGVGSIRYKDNLLKVLVEGIHGALALGILFSLIDVGSVFTACVLQANLSATLTWSLSHAPAAFAAADSAGRSRVAQRMSVGAEQCDVDDVYTSKERQS